MPLTVYITIGAFAAGLLSGGWGMHRYYLGEEAKAAKKELKVERGAQVVANQAAVRHVDRIIEQQEKARAIEKALRAQLAAMGPCTVPGGVVGVLNDATVPANARPAGDDPGSQDAAPARNSDAGAELAICARNYTEVCIPNAQSLNACIAAYNAVKRCINEGDCDSVR